MPHSLSLVSTIAAAFGLALVLGFAATRIALPPLVGYLLAGVALGPYTPGFVADVALAGELSQIGVMLMMLGVGLHFSIGDLLAVRRIALPGAVLQIALSTALGAATALAWGWSAGGALVFGLALSVASTVVLLRSLEARGALDTGNGRIAIGWLVVQDLVMVLVLVLLPPAAGLLAGDGLDGSTLARAVTITVAKAGAFVVLMLVVGRRVFPRLLWWMAKSGSRELFTLCVVAAAVGVAYGSAMLFDVSFALGAFFAGMMMRESEFAHRAADESLPLRDAFSVLFFVSVGMLFDPHVLVDDPLRVLAVVAVIMLGNTLAAVALVLAFGYPLGSALTIGASVAQIGEFSFILASLGGSLGVLPAEGNSLILAGALISIAANPLVFAAIEPLLAWAREHSPALRRLEARDDPLAALPAEVDPSRMRNLVVMVGYGRVGSRIAARLREAGIPLIVAERDRALVESLRAEGINAVAGDAADPLVLVQAHVAKARLLVVAAKDAFDVRLVAATARELNPEIEIVVRSTSGEEAALLEGDRIARAFVGEQELAQGMAAHVLERMK